MKHFLLSVLMLGLFALGVSVSAGWLTSPPPKQVEVPVRKRVELEQIEGGFNSFNATGMVRFYDPEYRVVCYVYRSSAMSCIPRG